MKIDQNRLEREIQVLGKEVFSGMRTGLASLLTAQFYTEKLLAWGMQDEELKVSLFRFVDVLPSLPDARSTIRHVQEYFEPLRGKIPNLMQHGLDVGTSSVTAKLVAPVIRKQISFIAERFIVGETPERALRRLRHIRKDGMAFTVDLLGEATVSEDESIVYKQRYLELIAVLAKAVPTWREAAPIYPGHRGEQTPVNVSVKLSALYSQAKAVSTTHSVEVFAERLSEILAAAKQVGAFVYVDMEDCSLTTITLRAFKAALMRPEFRDYDRCGIVLQAYLRRTRDDLVELIEWTKSRGTPIAVRLVKGAYWDTETILAKQNGWPIPVWQQKSSSDANYEALSLLLLENFQHTMPAFASHNIRSLCHAIKAAELMGVPATEFELQALYGMADPIKRVFSSRGYLVREYSPIGELIPGMGYLVRRLLENTSNEGFLRLSMHEQRNPEQLLARPQFGEGDTGDEHVAQNPRIKFANSPLTDMTIDDERAAIAAAVAELRNASSPANVQPIINGKLYPRQDHLLSTSPEDPGLTVAKVQLALPEDVERAIDGLARYANSWRRMPVTKRANVLFRAAELLQRDRASMTAVIVLEAGKNWIEADADVAEAIDFLNYYALEAEKLFTVRRMGSFDGESNRYFYEPRGVCAVISPWNFPLAIPCGMLVAALVTGNTALLKPAEQTSLTAFRLFKILLDAGLPPEAAAFIPARGEDAGPVIMAHREISTVVFTGSKEIGLLLNRQGAQFSDGAAHVKRVITEMGGKNAIIVDDDADYDEAVKAIVQSAFGYSGQKCSACSRAIIVGDVYDRMLARLAEATKSLNVGAASDPRTFVGPVIDSEAAERIRGVIQRARQSCTLVAEGPAPSTSLRSDSFVRPAIFADIPDGHELSNKEIFGPVLAVERARSFEQAIEMANASEYGLTGAVFSRSPKHIELACAEFQVGNLYINRGSTGALVMRQPFGGAKMSGVGSKAGGPDYLLQFVVPRSVTENTMRRGFAPKET